MGQSYGMLHTILVEALRVGHADGREDLPPGDGTQGA